MPVWSLRARSLRNSHTSAVANLAIGFKYLYVCEEHRKSGYLFAPTSTSLLCGFTFSFPLVQQTWPGGCPPSSHFFSHPPFPLSPTAPACVGTTSRIWQRRPPACRDGTLPKSWIPYIVRTSYCPNRGYVVRGFLPIIIKPPPTQLMLGVDHILSATIPGLLR